MATLYSDPEWSSKNLETVVFEARRHVVKDKMPALFPDQLYKWREDLQKHSQEGYKTTFTDFWGKLIEYSLGDKKNECKLSDQRAALCRGQNPLPIYLTINVKDDVSNQDFREWFEFSPYEVGMQKYGAFIPSELFGSEFFMGRLMKRIPEPEMCYMLETTVVIPTTWLSNTFREILTRRPFVSEFHNFLYGMQLHTDYLQNRQFSMWKGPSPHPQLTSGHLASSAHGSPMLLQPLKQTCEYCTEQKIPFPSFSILEDDNSLKECYVMENPQEPDAPIVAYFPLISDTFQKYKAPGVERSPDELELGQLNIYGPKSPYATKELTYTEAAFDKLVKLSEYNILNNRDKLIQALRLAMEKKRMRSQCPS
ncbi:phospholipase A2, group IVE [Mus musculus]|nr:phospholipase A2, group IVE [Mus musculus]